MLLVVTSGTVPILTALQVQAQTSPTPTPGQPEAVLTIVVRDSIGNPLQGLVCEVLSYGWGLQINEAYAVIAKGETDKNGVVAFDDSRWPNSGYRFKFSATDHLKPANTYILPDDQNQYRGYPGAVVGGRTETQRFVLSGSDSVFYNDISKEGQSPAYQRDPIAGLAQPRVSVMDGQAYLATAIAATSTAEARGEPTPTMPSPPSPSPRPGEIQPALTVTPGAALTAAASSTATGTNTGTRPATIQAAITGTPRSTGTVSTTGQTTSVVVAQADQSPASTGNSGNATRAVPSAVRTGAIAPTGNNTGSPGGSNLLVSILLALFGITCLILFWKFRFKIYPLFGIESSLSPRKKVNPRSRLTDRPVKAPQPSPAQPQANQHPDRTANDIEEEEKEVD